MGSSKFFNLVAAILFTVVLTLSLTFTIYSKTAVDILTDRDMMREWLVDEQIQQALVEYVVEQAFSPLTVDIAEKVLGEEQYSEVIYNQLIENASEKITTESIDAIYDWLEGEADSPVIEIEIDEEDLNLSTPLAVLLDEKLGFLSEFFDVEDLVRENSTLTLLNIEPDAMSKIPRMYQVIQRAPQIFIFLSILSIIVIILTLRSWRKILLLVGLAFTISGVIILFGHLVYDYQDLVNSKILEIIGLSLPSTNTLPQFAQLLLSKAAGEISEASRVYGKYMFFIGLLTVVLSQLAIRVVEDEDLTDGELVSDGSGVDEYDDEIDYFDEESEEMEEE